jgi:hypothetical protein
LVAVWSGFDFVWGGFDWEHYPVHSGLTLSNFCCDCALNGENFCARCPISFQFTPLLLWNRAPPVLQLVRTATLALLHGCTLHSVVVFLICDYNLPARCAFSIFVVECSPSIVLEEDDHLKLRAVCCYMSNSNQSPIWLYF